MGALLVSLDTSGQQGIRVCFTAGTVLANDRVYGLRPQYRIGIDGVWKDFVKEDSSIVEYIRNESDGHSERFDSLTLPAEAEDQGLVQIQWRYYLAAGDDGKRAQLRLDDIFIGTGSYSLSFSAGPNGTVEGDSNRNVAGGESGPEITAVPAEGYIFAQWSDGRVDNPRTDLNVSRNMTVKAVFALPGDVNMNGRIDVADACMLAGHAAGIKTLTKGEKRAGNVYGREDYENVGLSEALKLLGILIKAD